MMNRVPDHILLSEGWEVEIYQKWNFPSEVMNRWRALTLRQGDIGLFLSDGWFEAWWNAFGGRDQLLVLILKKGGETKGIFPCRIKSASEDIEKKGVPRSLTNDHTCYYNFIIDPEVREEVLSQFIVVLHRITTSGETTFECLPFSEENLSAFIRLLRRDRTPVHISHGPWAPCLELSGDWDRFSAALPGRLRNTLRRCRKKAEEKGRVDFEVIRQSQQLNKVLDALFEIEYRSWKGKEGTAIKSEPEVESFYRLLAHWAMEENRLFLFFLKLDGLPIAGSFCLSSGKTVYLLKPGYDESFSAFSPGSLLQAEILKYLFMAPEISVYNFLGACDRWKMEWTASSGEASTVRVYPKSLRGWSRYFFKYGWKNQLKRFRSGRGS